MILQWAAHRRRVCLSVLAAIVAVATVLGVTAQVASARPADSGSFRWSGGPKPVIVLEHGAWADASGWDQVIRLLQKDGFTVYAPPNPLRGLPQDSASLHAFLTQNAALAGQPVVLVGHSYGGAVITNAADGDPAVKALLYVDAFIPDQGETLLQLVSAQPGSCLGGNPADVFNFVPIPGGGRCRHLHQAEPGPQLLRLRPARRPGRGHRRYPAAAGSQRPERALRNPRVEDRTVLGCNRHH